jgi:hypothetical protein
MMCNFLGDEPEAYKQRRHEQADSHVADLRQAHRDLRGKARKSLLEED